MLQEIQELITKNLPEQVSKQLRDYLADYEKLKEKIKLLTEEKRQTEVVLNHQYEKIVSLLSKQTFLQLIEDEN